MLLSSSSSSLLLRGSWFVEIVVEGFSGVVQTRNEKIVLVGGQLFFLLFFFFFFKRLSGKRQQQHLHQSCLAMATAVYGNSMTPLPTTNQPNRPVLRRATYVHVSDLTSAYNIDHGMLEQELSRVKAEQEAGTETGTETQLPTVPPDVGDTDVDTGADSEIGAALGATPQKRLQPPRGGYNLCV